MFEQALAIFELRPERNATRVADLLNDIGLRLENEDPARSRALLNKAIHRYRGEFGRHHPATLLAMNNLAAILHDGGRPDEAAPLLLRVLEARLEVLPDESTQIAYTLYRLGRVSLDLGRRNDAETHLSEAAQILSDQLPDDDNRVLLARHYLALSLQQQGHRDQAPFILRENLARIQNRYGGNHDLVDLTQSAL